MTQERFKLLLMALGHLNDLQINYFKEVRDYLTDQGFYQYSVKSHLDAIDKLLHKNTASTFSGKYPERCYEDLGSLQDNMERIIELTYNMLFELDKKFMVFTFTDYYVGDKVWINLNGKPMNVEVMRAKCSADFETEPVHHTDVHFVVEVQALNKNGVRYGKRFWVGDEHIAKHKKEITDKEDKK